MKRRLLSLLLATLSLVAVLSGEEWSLQRAIDRALTVNHELLSRQKHIDYLKAEKSTALTKYFPRLNLNLSYTKLNDPIVLDLDPMRNLLIALQTQDKLSDLDTQMLLKSGRFLTAQERSVYSQAISTAIGNVIPNLDMTLLDQNVFRTNIELFQPIWIGGKIQALNRGASLQVQEGTEELLISREAVLKETSRIYFLNKLLEAVVDIHRKAEEGIRLHYKRAEDLYRSGLVAKYQLLRAKVAHSEAQKNLKNSEDNLTTARTVLRNLLELPDNAEVTLTTPLKYLPKSEKSGEVWSRVEANNGTLKKLEIKKALVKVKKKADLAEYLPQIYAFGRYEIAKDDLSLLDPEWAVGVGVKLNLFSSGEKIFKMQADNRLIQEVEEKKKEVVTLLKSLSDKLYYEADAKKNSLETYPTRLEEAEENLKLADSRFSTGLGISLEVVDAHLMLQKIQTEELQALYEYNLSWLKIHGLFQNTAEIISQWEAQK